MARRRKSKKATTKRRSYKTRAARGTRKGQARKTARRAYSPVRRRARRNPKGPLSSPAVQYGLATAAGFAAASYADTWPMLNPVDDEGNPRLPFGLKGSVLAGVITLVAAQYALRGKNKQYARAAAVGMFAPTAISMIQAAVAPGDTAGGASHRIQARRNLHRIAASRGAAVGFAKASRNLDNAAA